MPYTHPLPKSESPANAVLSAHSSPEPLSPPLPPSPQPPLWILLGTALVVVAGGTWFFLHPTGQSPVTVEAQLPAVAVTTSVVQPQIIQGLQALTGTVEPTETVTLTSKVMGQIQRLPIQEGDRVHKGQIVAEIDVNDLQAQRHQTTAVIAQAQAGVTVAQAAAIQASTVQTQAITQVDQAEARQQEAAAKRLQAQAELSNAQLNQRRMEALRREGAVSQSMVDDANTKVAVIQTQIAQANASIHQAQHSLDQSRAAVAQAKAGVDQARAGIHRATSQVEQAQAEHDQTQANLDYGIVKAPFEGVVTQKQTEIGAIAGSGQPLMTLEGTRQLRFHVEVPESLMNQVKLGQSVTIHLDALSQTIHGSVYQVIPSANSSSHSFSIKIKLPPVDSVIPGMFGRLEVPNSSRSVLMVPQTALLQRGQLQGVYVAEAATRQPIAVLRWVKTGKTQKSQVEIVSGLVAGDRIITRNIPQLQDGQPVALEP